MTDPVLLAAALPHRLAKLADYFCGAGLIFGVDPLLLAAICDRESNGGDALIPVGSAGTGDHGNGLGIFQLDKRYQGWFAKLQLPEAIPGWQHPAWNTFAAAHLLAGNLRKAGGNEPIAIAAYNSGQHAFDVMAMKELAGDALIAALDVYTTDHYVKDVLRRRADFEKVLNGGNNV